MLSLLACADGEAPAPADTDTGTVEDTEFPRADPWLVMVASIDESAGALRSTCALTVTLSDEAGAVGPTTVQGRDWIGIHLTEAVLYTATASWSECTNFDDGTGSIDTSAFSGGPGDLFVFHYNAYTAEFDTLRQDEDFAGGQVDAEFAKGAAPAVDGAEAEAVDATHWRFVWASTMSPAAVLTAITEDEAYVSGAPAWIEKPGWW